MVVASLTLQNTKHTPRDASQWVISMRKRMLSSVPIRTTVYRVKPFPCVFRWGKYWALLRPVTSWWCDVTGTILEGHRGGLVGFANISDDRKIFDRKFEAKDEKDRPEFSEIIKHNSKFKKLDIVSEGIPFHTATKFCPEYDDVRKIIGDKIHRNIPKCERASKGHLRYWVVDALRKKGMRCPDIIKLLKAIHIPDVQVWWPVFIMCHPVYCVEARGNPVGRLTLCMYLRYTKYHGLCLCPHVPRRGESRTEYPILGDHDKNKGSVHSPHGRRYDTDGAPVVEI